MYMYAYLSLIGSFKIIVSNRKKCERIKKYSQLKQIIIETNNIF